MSNNCVFLLLLQAPAGTTRSLATAAAASEGGEVAAPGTTTDTGAGGADPRGERPGAGASAADTRYSYLGSL